MLEPGHQLLHYRIVEKIGEGGMGEVYRARDTKLERDVALKIVPAAFAADEQRMARFAREAQVLASLNHPYVGAIYGLEEHEGIRALVLELIEGEDLSERIARGPLPMNEVLRIGRQIAEGMESAHAKGVIHRDLKPANVKITGEGVTKVLDFGLAKALADDEPSSPNLSRSPTLTVPPTEAGFILGTAGYMAPEQARGLPVDRRSDIWAFGVVLYEMLTGVRLFAGNTVTDVLAAVIRAEPDMEKLPADTSPALRRLLRRCLAKEPADRMRDFGDVLLDLREASEPPDPAEVATGTEAASAPPRSRAQRAVFGALGLALLILAGVAGFVARGMLTTDSPLHASILPPKATRFHLEVSSPGPPALSPEGRMIAFSAIDDQGTVRLYVRRLDASEAYVLSGTEGAGYPFWSPDGKSIGFFVRTEAKLKKISATGGPALTLCAAPNGKGGAWTSDGRIIFAPRHDSGLAWVRDTGGVSTPLTEPDHEQGENSHRHPWLMPDGHHVLFLARGRKLETGDRGAILAIPVDGGEPRFVMAASGGAIYVAGHILFPHQGVLMAQPFDASALRPDGDPFPVAQDLRFIGGAAKGVFTASGENVLAFMTGAATGGRALRWLSAAGAPEETLGDESMYDEIEISPDGNYVAATVFQSGQDKSDVWVYDIQRGVGSRFTFSEGADGYVAWSPDGQRIYFGSEKNAVSQIYAKPVGGTEAEELVFESDISKYPVDVSPDERFLSYDMNSPNTGWDVWVVPLIEDGEPFVAVGGEFNQTNGRFSPDGRWMTYSSTESGRREIYVIRFPNSGRKWQISTNGGNNPRWEAGGKRLYFQDATGAVNVIDIETRDESIVVGTPQVMFRRPLTLRYRYAPTRDGQRFLVVDDTVEQEMAPLELVLNWTSGLER